MDLWNILLRFLCCSWQVRWGDKMYRTSLVVMANYVAACVQVVGGWVTCRTILWISYWTCLFLHPSEIASFSLPRPWHWPDCRSDNEYKRRFHKQAAKSREHSEAQSGYSKLDTVQSLLLRILRCSFWSSFCAYLWPSSLPDSRRR